MKYNILCQLHFGCALQTIRHLAPYMDLNTLTQDELIELGNEAQEVLGALYDLRQKARKARMKAHDDSLTTTIPQSASPL